MKSHLAFEQKIKQLDGELITLKKVDYFFASEGVTYIRFRENNKIEEEDSLEEFDMLEKRKSHVPLRAIVIVEPFVSFSTASKKFWISGKGKSKIHKEAILDDSISPRIMLLATKAVMPKIELNLRFFKSIEKAENWVRT